MSRKLLMVAALAVVALPVATAQAQVGFGVAAGLSAPMGDFKDAVDAGYHLTGIVNFSAPLAPIGFRGEVSFNQFNFKSGIGFPADAKDNILSGTANAVVSAPGMMGIYGIGGLGLYRGSCSWCGVSSTSENKVGFNVGAGFKFGLSGFAAFVEARYHHISTTGGSTSFVPVSFGLTF
jgi:opacity protein-like surface antigen